jgi:hypothetical protein
MSRRTHIIFYWAFNLLPTINNRAKWATYDRDAFIKYLHDKYDFAGNNGPKFGGYPVTVSLEAQVRPSRYDVDNLVKPMLDAVTASRAIWIDDSQVVDLRVRKWPAAHSSIVCRVSGQVSDRWAEMLDRFDATYMYPEGAPR